MAGKGKTRDAGGVAKREQVIGESSSCLQCQEPGCTGGCPIGVGVPSVLSLVSSGKLEDAAALLRLRNPLASITGRLCPSHRFCEHACVLSRKRAPVPVREIEAFLGDISLTSVVKRGKAVSGRVLVVGSGPAGLMAAHDLHAEGFEVTVTEAEALVGGCLRLLPSGVIPAGILDAEVRRLARSGIAFETSSAFEAGDGLPPAGYSALALTTGLPCPRMAPLPVKLRADGLVLVDQANRTSLPRVYAAGGATSAYDNLTEAMASAREMAWHIVMDSLFSTPH